jgi:hypothetical protein
MSRHLSPRLRAATGVAALLIMVGSAAMFVTAHAAGARPAEAQLKIPDTLIDLPVKREDISKTLTGVPNNLATDQVSLYSIRNADNLLLATLEVGRFGDSADYKSGGFRKDLAAQIGASRSQVLRVGDQLVSITTAKGLTIAIWYRGRYLMVLSMRNTDFFRPKALLRAALEIKP